LDELDSAARLACDFYRDGEFTKEISRYNRTPDPDSFLDFAAWTCLPSYIREKAPELARGQLQRARRFIDCPDGIMAGEGVHKNKKLLLNREKLTGEREGPTRLEETAREFDKAIRPKKKEDRRARWDRAKERFFSKKRYPKTSAVSYRHLAHV
jgi:hypothetical protein